MLFWLFRTFLQSLFISNATNPPFTLGLRVKGDKRAASEILMMTSSVMPWRRLIKDKREVIF